jgi:putative hemolysin
MVARADHDTRPNAFALQLRPETRSGRVGLALSRPFLPVLFRLPVYRALYEKALSAPGATFEARALAALDIGFEVESSPAVVPTSGPVVIVSNHPRGAADGLVLAEVVRAARPDVRILANRVVRCIPELAERCFFVDPFGGSMAASRSTSGLRAARRWLERGGAVIVFPSGEVAARPEADRRARDSRWHPTAGRLALATGAVVVAAFIEGRNSPWFYRAGRVHPWLRTLLLPRELLKQRGETVRVRLAGPVYLRAPGSTPATPEQATAALREMVERLGVSSGPIVRRGGPDEEVRRLGPECRLLTTATAEVYCADAESIPHVLREIGRLREIAFRAVGEGTGRAIDLDRFDEHYLHLFVWHRERREVAGAYRIGPTDRILATQGADGLYTRTLFRYDAELLARLAPALELGRSFVSPDYQRSSNVLGLLWKGIGRLVAASPRYRILFGPVSMSRRYRERSRQLLITFLRQNHHDGELARLVEAVNPPRETPAAGCVTTLEDLDREIAQLEADGTRVPVLLRQYLKLNARLLGFSVDPAFGDTLDALMMVDLAAVDPAILARYLGREGAHRFLARNAGRPPRAAA